MSNEVHRGSPLCCFNQPACRKQPAACQAVLSGWNAVAYRVGVIDREPSPSFLQVFGRTLTSAQGVIGVAASAPVNCPAAVTVGETTKAEHHRRELTFALVPLGCFFLFVECVTRLSLVAAFRPKPGTSLHLIYPQGSCFVFLLYPQQYRSV